MNSNPLLTKYTELVLCYICTNTYTMYDLFPATTSFLKQPSSSSRLIIQWDNKHWSFIYIFLTKINTFKYLYFSLKEIHILNIQDTFHILSQHLLDIVTYAENAKIFLWVWIFKNLYYLLYSLFVFISIYIYIIVSMNNEEKKGYPMILTKI